MAKFINIDDVLFDPVNLNKENIHNINQPQKLIPHHKRTHSKSTDQIDFYDKFEFTASRKAIREPKQDLQQQHDPDQNSNQKAHLRNITICDPFQTDEYSSSQSNMKFINQLKSSEKPNFLRSSNSLSPMRLIKEELTGSGSCLESMTPTRINRIIDWTKKNVNVTQGDYQFPLVVAPSMELSQDQSFVHVLNSINSHQKKNSKHQGSNKFNEVIQEKVQEENDEKTNKNIDDKNYQFQYQSNPRDIQELTNQIQSYKQVLQMLKKNNQEIQQQNLEQQRSSLKMKQSLEEDIRILSSKLEEKVKELNKSNDKSNHLESEKNELTKTVSLLKDQINQNNIIQQSVISIISHENEISRIKSHYEKIITKYKEQPQKITEDKNKEQNSQNQNHQNLVETLIKCLQMFEILPTDIQQTNQILTNNSIESIIKNSIAQLLKKNEELDHSNTQQDFKIKSMTNNLNQIKQESSKQTQQIAKLKEENQSFLQQISNQQKQIENKNSTINDQQEGMKDIKEIENIYQNRIQQIQQVQDLQANEIRIKQEQVVSLNTSIQTIKRNKITN